MEPLRDSDGREVSLDIEVHTPCAPHELPPCPWQFPRPEDLDDYGLAGEGGDFLPGTIVTAYRQGIFPWPHPDAERLWFSPNPRAIIPIDGLHISRRLGRTIRAGRFRITVDAAFAPVMRGCAEGRPEGTWITPALLASYTALHELGHAHSVEVWAEDGKLAGGLYGVAVGAMFGAESMFHTQRDASKVAMAALLQHARTIGVQLIDVQVLTPHTASMGAIEIARTDYLARLGQAVNQTSRWYQETAPIHP